MTIVMGLGNPGPEYTHTAHNVGFDCIDIINKELNLQESNKKDYIETETILGQGKKVKFIKPLTYMNLSGMVFSKLRNTPIDEIIVFCDNIDLECGKVRFRYQGSCAGHNGLKSILQYSPKGNDFYRMYIGVGREVINGHMLDARDSVLRKLSEDKISILHKKCHDAVDAVLGFIVDGNVDNAKRKCSV